MCSWQGACLSDKCSCSLKWIETLSPCTLQVDIWTLQWPLPSVYLEETAGESFPCTSSFRQLGLFLVPQSFLECTMVRTDFRSGTKFIETNVTTTYEQIKMRFVFIRCLCVHKDALWDRPGAFNVTGSNATAGIFATYPGKHLTIVNGFFDQVPLANSNQTQNFVNIII